MPGEIRLKWGYFLKFIRVGRPTLTTYYLIDLLNSQEDHSLQYPFTYLALLTFSETIKKDYTNEGLTAFLEDARKLKFRFFKPSLVSEVDSIFILNQDFAYLARKMKPDGTAGNIHAVVGALRKFGPDFYKFTAERILQIYEAEKALAEAVRKEKKI